MVVLFELARSSVKDDFFFPTRSGPTGFLIYHGSLENVGFLLSNSSLIKRGFLLLAWLAWL
jgi:hypothetical protein